MPQRLDYQDVHAEMDGILFSFTRRRYGHTTFTWVKYHDGQAWNDAPGDPWPSVNVPARDLRAIAAEARKQAAQ